MSWNETIRELRRLVAEGYTSNEVEYKLSISRNAIISKARRLHLKWHAPASGGRARISSTPERFQKIATALKDGKSVMEVATELHAGKTTVQMIRDGVPRRPRKDATVPWVRPVAAPPPPPKPAVVTWLSGIRYGCQWMHGDRGNYRACGEPVAQLGGSWCQHHRAVVYVRRSSADAAD